MLICTKCNIEYEEGKKFCKACGNPLNKIQPVEEKPGGGLVCPDCKTVYPSGKFCRKCGSALISQVQHEQEVAPAPVHIQEPIQTRPPGKPSEEEKLICPNCKAAYDTGKFCKKCGSPLPARSTEIAVEPPMETQREAFRETPPPQPPEQQPVPLAKPLEAEEPGKEIKVRAPEKKPDVRKILPAKKKPVFRPLYIGVASVVIVVAVAGYLLWPKYSYFIKKQPPSSVGLVQKIEPPSTSHVTLPPPKTEQPPPRQSEAQEVEAMKNLLENIRQANLQKNIDLFMSCYSLDFKDREGRRAATLENWKNFDYLELSYDLKRRSISGDTANARVEWFILTSTKGGGQAQESKAVLDVTFKKENGGWKIKEIKPAG